MFACATVLQTDPLQTLGIDLPKQTLDLLLYLPLPVNAKGGDDGTDEENAQDDCRHLCHALSTLALLMHSAATSVVKKAILVANQMQVESMF